MDQPTKAGGSDRLNWDRLLPALDKALADSNASPALLGVPAEIGSEVISVIAQHAADWHPVGKTYGNHGHQP